MREALDSKSSYNLKQTFVRFEVGYINKYYQNHLYDSYIANEIFQSVNFSLSRLIN